MSLYESWLQKAYNKEGQSIASFWDGYMPVEQKIYEYMLKNKVNRLSGTIEEMAKRFHMDNESICGFLDGINEANEKPVEVDKLTETDFVEVVVDFEKLYKKMVEYKAEHLYELPEWEHIFSQEERKKMYKEQKKAGTVMNVEKVGRNEFCPCGSGKKYKKCCGAGA